jgi:DNA-binding NarL/FixJ family response regulator
MPEKIRVLVVDDHLIARIGLSVAINHEPDMQVVGECSGLAEALESYAAVLPDVVTMDYRLDAGTGIEATEVLLQQHPAAKVLMISTFDAEYYVFRAADSGVRGYITKDLQGQELAEAIRAVHAGKDFFKRDILEKLRRQKAISPLTQREYEVLVCIARGDGNKEISVAFNFTESLVKYYVKQILGKLGAKDRTHAAIIATRLGIIDLPPES